MARIKPLFRVLAVVNALLLLGAYVCYRGGVVQAFMAKPAEPPVQGDPAPVVQTPPHEGDSTPTPNLTFVDTEPASRTEINNVSMFPSSPSTTVRSDRPAAPASERQALLGGSKSMMINIEPPAKVQPSAAAPAPQSEAKAAPRQQPAAPVKPAPSRDVIMESSKSAKISIYDVQREPKPAASTPKPPQLTPEELEAIQRQILMSGSKSEIIYVQPSPAAAQPQQQVAPRQQQASPPAPVKRRAIMGGSKSAAIEIVPQSK